MSVPAGTHQAAGRAPHRPRRLVMIAVGYFLALQAGLLTEASPEKLASVWPASGVALAALLIYPRRAWGDVLGVLFITNLAVQIPRGLPVLTNLGFALANTIEPLLAAGLMVHLNGRRVTFTRFKDVMGLLSAATLANGVSAALGALVTWLSDGTSFWTAGRIWWVQDGLSMLLLTPLIILWLTQPAAGEDDVRLPGPFHRQLVRLKPRRPLEGLLMLAAVVVASWAIYGGDSLQSNIKLRPYMLLLLLGWPALRFRPRGAITAVALATPVALLSTAAGWQPTAAQASLVLRLNTVQAVLFGACASVLTLTTLFYEREQALAALRQSQALLAQAESIAHIGSWKLNLRDQRVHFSDEMYRMLGLTPGHRYYLSDQGVAQAIHLEDQEIVRYVLRQAWDTGQVQPVEFRLHLPDGSQRVLHAEGQFISEAEGEMQALIGYVQDITAAKQIKETIALNRDFYASLFHHSPVGTALVRLSDLLVEDANQDFGGLLGYTQDEMIGRPLLIDALPPGTPGRQQIIDQIQARRPIRDQEITFITKDGQGRQGLLFVDYIAKQSQDYLLIKCIDITARKQAEQQRQEMLKEKEYLLRELYHRTNNNMQVISALLDMQARECQAEGDTAGERVRALLNDAQVRIRSMSLIHDRLYRSQNLASIDFGACLADLVELVRQRYSGLAGRVCFKVDAQPIPLSIDLAVPCALVANELLTNAVKHAFPGQQAGQVTVRLAHLGEQSICLEVSDDGVGLPPGMDPLQSSRMGLQTVFGITTSQLRGRVELLPGPGVHWQITFTNIQLT